MRTQLKNTLKDTVLGNKGYLEIRESCKLIEYDLKLAISIKSKLEPYTTQNERVELTTPASICDCGI